MSLFSERLKEARSKKGVLQKHVAELLKISDRQYRSYEAGEVDPPLSKVIALADYFGVSIDYLTGRTDNPEVNR